MFSLVTVAIFCPLMFHVFPVIGVIRLGGRGELKQAKDTGLYNIKKNVCPSLYTFLPRDHTACVDRCNTSSLTRYHQPWLIEVATDILNMI